LIAIWVIGLKGSFRVDVNYFDIIIAS